MFRVFGNAHARILSCAAAAGLAACSGPLSTLDPAGPAAHELAPLTWILLTGAGIVTLGMLGLVLYAFKQRRGLRRVPDRIFLWGGGLAFPLVVLAVLLAWALPAGQSMIGGRDDGVMRVDIEAFQWGWRVSYPDGGVAEAELDVLRIPAGEPVDVYVTSADVIHSFWVPRLAGKIDAIPGRTNIVRIQADAPGTYAGVCAEFCGLDHARMDFTVEAYAPEEAP